MVDSIGGGSQEITAKAEKIPIPGVQTCNRTTAHTLHFVSDRDARNRRPADVAIGNQE